MRRAGDRAIGRRHRRGSVHVLICIVTRCASSGATKSPTSLASRLI
jgi:hypothetical protein